MNAAPVAVSKAIDPARVGLSKSLMTSPCERKGFYSETVRDGNGRRPSFPMPERVTFGTAVDEAVSYILFHDRDGTPWTPEVAIETGLARARASLGWSLIADPDVFELQVGNAIKLYVSALTASSVYGRCTARACGSRATTARRGERTTSSARPTCRPRCASAT
jgi:hypothetical protein